MIDLTPEQSLEVKTHETARLRDPVTGETFILLRAALYERMRPLLDDSVCVT